MGGSMARVKSAKMSAELGIIGMCSTFFVTKDRLTNKLQNHSSITGGTLLRAVPFVPRFIRCANVNPLSKEGYPEQGKDRRKSSGNLFLSEEHICGKFVDGILCGAWSGYHEGQGE
jgi:hypothetical protein